MRGMKGVGEGVQDGARRGGGGEKKEEEEEFATQRSSVTKISMLLHVPESTRTVRDA